MLGRNLQPRIDIVIGLQIRRNRILGDILSGRGNNLI